MKKQTLEQPINKEPQTVTKDKGQTYRTTISFRDGGIEVYKTKEPVPTNSFGAMIHFTDIDEAEVAINLMNVNYIYCKKNSV